MATKAVLMMCSLTMVTTVLMGFSMRAGGIVAVATATAAADDDTYLNVVATYDILFGAANFFAIQDQDSEIFYEFKFFFGLGATGYPVRTDTAVTLGSASRSPQIYACKDGTLDLLPVGSSGTPENAIVRVRYNSTDNNYRLQITEASPAVYIQFEMGPRGEFRCASGVAGTPIRFAPSNSLFSDHLHEPTPIRFAPFHSFSSDHLHEPTIVLSQE